MPTVQRLKGPISWKTSVSQSCGALACSAGKPWLDLSPRSPRKWKHGADRAGQISALNAMINEIEDGFESNTFCLDSGVEILFVTI